MPTRGIIAVVSPKPTAKKKPAAKKHGPRKDLGKPIDGFFARQPAKLRPILEALRKLVEDTVPDATASIKWGMPFYEINGNMMAALDAHKAHVNLILSGPPDAFRDPDKRLTGEGKTGRHLKLTSLADLPRDAARAWIKTAAELARAKT